MDLLLLSILLHVLYWRGFCDVRVALFDASVTLEYTLDVHPLSDSTEMADAVPMDLQNHYSRVSFDVINYTLCWMTFVYFWLETFSF